MKHLNKKLTIILLCLLGFFYGAKASYFEADTTDNNSQKKEYFLLFDVVQPLLFGKVGIAVGLRNIKYDYVFYGNYVFDKGAIPTTLFKVEYEHSGGFEDRKGFDVGVQLKKRSKLLSKPYKDYIKNVSNITKFYSGGWLEVSQKSGSEPISINYGVASYNIWEFKIGGLLGWSIDTRKSNMLYDINMGVAIGKASGKIFIVRSTSEGRKVSSGIMAYKISFQIGFKS